MAKRITVILVVLMLLTSFSAFATSTQEPATPSGGGMMEATGPQYGGTLTLSTQNDPPSPDIQDAQHAALEWAELIQERPIHGAVEELGPRGSGAYEFKLVAYIPAAYQAGHLISDWEVTTEQMVWTIREGVTWQAVDGVMDSRPFTAADMAADIERFRASPWGNRFDNMLGEVTVQGNKVVMEFINYSPDLFYFIGYEDRAIVRPPETIAAGAKQWENQGGTGAFKFGEYVVGSYMSYVRRDDYWDTTVIDGKEYEMPFLDEVRRVIFPDQATVQAALRTGQVDLTGIPAQQWDTLERTAPDLLKTQYGDMAQVITLDVRKPPFDNKEVRRALFIGTDIARFQQFGRATSFPLHSFPAWPGNPSVYTPLDKLPADVAELYDYNPEKAKQMLAAAGYPNGFEMSFYFNSDDVENQDFASLLQATWGEIGVKVNPVGTDYVTYRNYRDTLTYEDAIIVGTQIGNPVGSISNLFQTGAFVNYAGYSNPVIDDYVSKINNELDPLKQDALIKAAAVVALGDASQIGTYLIPQAIYYWPWIKNYYGEVSIEDGTLGGLIPYMWIDQDLKESMGY
jgi:peptide/nickel transport system substrate-binding protein